MYFHPDAKFSSAACDCTGPDSDNMSRQCIPRTAAEMKQIVASGRGADFALRDHRNFSDGLLFLDPTSGLFGAWSFDTLHTLEKGLLCYIREWVLEVFSGSGVQKLQRRGEYIIADGGARTSSRSDFFVFKENYPRKMCDAVLTDLSASETSSVLALLILSIGRFSDWTDADVKRGVTRPTFLKALQAFIDSFWFLVGLDELCQLEEVPNFEEGVIERGLARIVELASLTGEHNCVSNKNNCSSNCSPLPRR